MKRVSPRERNWAPVRDEENRQHGEGMAVLSKEDKRVVCELGEEPPKLFTGYTVGLFEQKGDEPGGDEADLVKKEKKTLTTSPPTGRQLKPNLTINGLRMTPRAGA